MQQTRTGIRQYRTGSAGWVFRLVTLGLLLAALAACNGEPKEAAAPGALVMDQTVYEAWEIALVEMRIEKNEAFADSAQTPLPLAQLASFEGLNYYFPRADLRFRTPFLQAAGTDTVQLTKRRGEVVPYLRRGLVRFTHEGREHTLPIFGPAGAGQDSYLWLPFTDATTGGDTYAGGRYLDITLDQDGLIDLDFNRAYNPLCDYNPDKYNCTLPPAESRLGFAVQAGEKIFGAGQADSGQADSGQADSGQAAGGH